MRLLATIVALISAHATSAQETPAERFHTLLTTDWEYQKQQAPALAALARDHRWANQWPDLSAAAIQARHDHDQATLRELRAIDPKRLPIDDRLTYTLFERDLQARQHEHELRAHLTSFWDFTRYGRPIFYVLGSLPGNPTSLRAYDEQLEQLETLPHYLTQQTQRLQSAKAAGLLPQRERLDTLLKQIAADLGKTTAQSAFFAPFTRFPDAIAPADRARLAQTATHVLDTTVRPALGSFHSTVEKDILPACPESPSLTALTGGAALYTALVRRSTTSAMPPAAIHELGLREVQRIRAAMTQLIVRLGHKGTLDEFLGTMTSDPRFYYANSDDLLNAYRATAKRIDPLVVRLFQTLPRMPYGVEPYRITGGPAATYAPANALRGGVVTVDVSNPAIRPKFEMIPLLLHEGMPGHHLQMALARERYPVTANGLPVESYLRSSEGFTEGWGLYAESLGYELGLYQDAYDELGYLSMDLLRAVRLVIDTGIHWHGWTVERATEYFTAQTRRPTAVVKNEISRATISPGSLLAYKVGEQHIKALRAEAAARLGDKFDLRAFHDKLLRTGPLPLDLLQSQME